MNTLIVAAIRCSLIFLVPALAYAGSAQWDLNPISGDWNTANNWTPMTVPNGPTDIATFDLSNTTNVSISANTEVDAITFTSAATNPYTITLSPTLTLTISGTGITNNSGIVQHVLANGGEAVNGEFGSIRFTNNASAGSSATFTNNHGTNNFFGGITLFSDTSTAGSAMFINNNGTVGGDQFQGETVFFDSSTAGHGTFINNGSRVSNYGNGGSTGFLDTSSAGNAMITNNGATASNAYGGQTGFVYNSTAGSATIFNKGGAVSGAHGGGTGFFAYYGDPTAGSATIINDGGAVSGAYGGLTDFSSFNGTPTAGGAILVANGGSNGGQGGMISFEGNSIGGTSRVEVFGNGSLDISGHDSPGVTIGSIEGDGDVFLGANNLTVGNNNLSTTFSGAIQDGGFSGSLSEIGTRMLILTAANAHSGVSNINSGVLQVDGSVLSDTFAIQDGGIGGSFTKIGTGTLELTGINAYTGDTNVAGGVLQIDGSIASNTFVNEGGTLAGRGAVNGAVTNNDRGMISPGNALGVPGVLTIGSNYTQVPTATLLIQIGGADAGQVSVLDVRGSANLNGYLDPVLVNGFVPRMGQSFTILNYTSHTGSFSYIQNQVFDHGRKRWLLVYLRTSARLIAVGNGR
jgi:autotransporter-associated beta strand protein